MKQPRDIELCTVPEAARRSGLGLRQIRRAIEAGEVSVYQIGSWPRLRWREVVAFIDACRRRRSADAGERER